MMTDELYVPNNIVTDTFLSELPVSLIKENIKVQFKEPLEHKTDYVSVFIDKYNYLMDTLSEDDDDIDYEESLDELNRLRGDFITFMEKRFFKKLNIGIVDFEDLSNDEQNEKIKMLYSYFILNIKKNFTNLVLNYISEFKRSLLSSVNKSKKKDVTSLSLKKEITSQDDIDIIANLGEIVNLVLEGEIDLDRFISMSESNKNAVECEWLKDQYENFLLTGNFVEKYKKMIDNDFKYELEISVRNKILKKYRSK